MRRYGNKSPYLTRKRVSRQWFAFLIWVVLALLLYFVLVENVEGLSDQARILSAALVGLPAVVLTFSISRYWEKIASRFERGQKGESAVFRELEALPDDWVLFQDAHIGDSARIRPGRADCNNPINCLKVFWRRLTGRGSGGQGNIDYILLGPTGVFILEVKSHAGRVAYGRRGLSLDGRRVSFLRQARGEAAAVGEFLERTTEQKIFIRAILVFSNRRAEVELGFRAVEHVNVLHLRSLRKFLAYGPEILNRANRAEIETKLQRLVSIQD